MSDKSIVQLNLFDDNVDSINTESEQSGNSIDAHPIVLSKTYRFQLRYTPMQPEDMYCIQDWIAGIASCDTKSAQKIRTKMRNELSTSSRQLPIQASDGKFYQMEHTDQWGLYAIAQHMRATKTRPILQKVKDYLASSGVFVDAVRTNKDNMRGKLLSTLAADSQSATWAESRLMGKISRRFFMENFFALLKEQANYALATDNVYRGTFGLSTQALQKRLGISNPKRQELRDKLSVPALNALSTAEYLCGLRLSQYGDDDFLPDAVVYETILEVAQAVGFENQETTKLMRDMGYDYLTGLPLLKKGHHDYE